MGSGFTNDVMHAENVDFSGGFPISGQVTTNGQLLIGSTSAPNIRVGTISNGTNITWTTGAGTLQADVSGPASSTNLTNHGVVIGQGANPLTATTAGTANQVLQSQGASSDPNWSTATYPSTATGTGTILRADGTNWSATTATYPTTTTANQILYSSANNVIAGLAAGTNNSILMGNTGAAPAFTTSGTPYVAGISFDSGGNTLSNYETGTFTPNFSSTSINITYTARVGTYTRIGNKISVSLTVWANAITNGGSGTLTVTGLPFTSRNTSNLNNVFTHYGNFNMGGSNSMISWLNSPNTTTLQLISMVISAGTFTSSHAIGANEFISASGAFYV